MCRATNPPPVSPKAVRKHRGIGRSGGGLVALRMHGSDTGLLLNVIHCSRGFLASNRWRLRMYT